MSPLFSLISTVISGRPGRRRRFCPSRSAPDHLTALNRALDHQIPGRLVVANGMGLANMPIESRRVIVNLKEDKVIGVGLRLGHLKLSDRKSTRLNSSHVVILKAVFCVTKKNYLF